MADDTMGASETEATVRAFYEALSTGDTAVLSEVLAPEWEAIPALRTGRGPEGWEASVRHLRSVFTDLHVTIDEVIVHEDRAAVRSTVRGIHTGELLGVDGTGATVEFRAADTHRLAGPRIVQTWHLEDYFAVATQLGLTFTLDQ